MKLKLKEETAKGIGLAKFKPFGLSEESWNWRNKDQGAELVLEKFGAAKLNQLSDLLQANVKVKGVRQLLQDLDTWLLVVAGKGPKARTIEIFGDLLKAYLAPVEGHRVYVQQDDDGDTGPDWLPYYVNTIRYTPARKERDYYAPPYVTMNLICERFGYGRTKSVRFDVADGQGKTAAEALAAEGIQPETPELRAAHLASVARFNEVTKQIGRQFLAVGTGTTSGVDGNPAAKRDDWFYRHDHVIQLHRDTGPSRVVMDLFFESSSGGGDKEATPDPTFWSSTASLNEDAEDDGDEDAAAAEPVNIDMPEVPLHPYVVVFDLARHLRLKLHVNQLTDYTYDPNMADKLVLPADRKALVQLLVETKAGGFQDIVAGKGGGAVVLLAGPPGTGKTLTAEVYAEAEGRALYSVQCSQLGIDPGTLEDELLKVFTRAKRWNAVLLLDEADVYVHERGNDLNQNAIVGVFLRTLEYQDTVLFLTTNRPEDVDDAIASRCIAKLTYPVPSPADQKRIWRILVDGTKAKMADDVIDQVVATNPHLSGRDVKNLIKLARLLQPEGITADAIEFVKQFKPTTDQADQVPVVAVPAGVARCPDCGRLTGKTHDCPKRKGA